MELIRGALYNSISALTHSRHGNVKFYLGLGGFPICFHSCLGAIGISNITTHPNFRSVHLEEPVSCKAKLRVSANKGRPKQPRVKVAGSLLAQT